MQLSVGGKRAAWEAVIYQTSTCDAFPHKLFMCNVHDMMKCEKDSSFCYACRCECHFVLYGCSLSVLISPLDIYKKARFLIISIALLDLLAAQQDKSNCYTLTKTHVCAPGTTWELSRTRQTAWERPTLLLHK